MKSEERKKREDLLQLESSLSKFRIAVRIQFLCNFHFLTLLSIIISALTCT